MFFAAWRRQWGTAAELCVVPAEHAVPLPDVASDDYGASMGIPALTAYRCLFADGPIDGATVLGAVGKVLVDIGS